MFTWSGVSEVSGAGQGPRLIGWGGARGDFVDLVTSHEEKETRSEFLSYKKSPASNRVVKYDWREGEQIGSYFVWNIRREDVDWRRIYFYFRSAVELKGSTVSGLNRERKREIGTEYWARSRRIGYELTRLGGACDWGINFRKISGFAERGSMVSDSESTKVEFVSVSRLSLLLSWFFGLEVSKPITSWSPELKRSEL